MEASKAGQSSDNGWKGGIDVGMRGCESESRATADVRAGLLAAEEAIVPADFDE